MIVLVDVDGVLTDCQTPLLEIANRVSGQSFTLDQLDRWNLFEAMGLDKDQTKQCYELMGASGWCSALRPYPEAQEAIERIRAYATVHFVTSPVHTSKTWAHERTMWLCEHFGARFDDVTSTSSKHRVAGDVLIDDKIKTIRRWQRSHPDGAAILFEAHGNRGEDWSRRARHWADVESLLDILAPNRQTQGLERKWIP